MIPHSPGSGRRGDRPRQATLALLLVAFAATAAVSPLFFLGNPEGHDFEFHVTSWLEVSRQWHEGILLPRWASGANSGFGEPRFIFYPPVSWSLGAALGSILPWRMVPGAMDWIALVLAGMAMFWLARDWLAPPEAACAALLYALNPYNLMLVFERCDFAEFLAVALYPLLLRGVLRLKQDGPRGVISLAAIFAAIWLSNAPAGVIAAYSLVLLLLAAAFQERAASILGKGAVAIAAGFGLAAFYILPAAYEQKWVNIGAAVSGELNFQQNFLFAANSDPDYLHFNHEVSWLAVTIAAAALVSAWIALSRRTGKQAVSWLLGTWGIASILLMQPYSAALWRLLPKLEFLQFPWRWTGPLVVALSFFAAACAGKLRRKWLIWGLLFTGAGLGGVFVSRDAEWNPDAVPDMLASFQQDPGFEGKYEYTLRGTDHEDLPGNAALAAFSEDEGDAPEATAETAIRIQTWRAEQKAFFVQATHPATIALRLVNYPAWQVWINGKRAEAQSDPDTGQMLIPIPAGANSVDVLFARTHDRWAGGVISLVTASLLELVWLVQKRPEETRAG